MRGTHKPTLISGHELKGGWHHGKYNWDEVKPPSEAINVALAELRVILDTHKVEDKAYKLLTIIERNK